MIELYRHADCAECAEFEEKLKELVVAHRVIMVKADQPPEQLPVGTSLPALKENGKIMTEPAAITAYLKELEKFVTDWRRFQGDACYIGDEGEVC